MKKLLLLLPVGLVLAACTPTQGVKPRVYAGSSAEILAAISQIAPTVQPTRVHNFFSVVETTPTQVTVRADSLTGLAIFSGNDPVTVTFTALQNGTSTSVSHFVKFNTSTPITPSSPIGQAVENIYKALGEKYTQIQ